MQVEKVILREDDPSIFLTAFIHDDSMGNFVGKRPAMIVLAGGAYAFLANNREGEPVAIKYFAHGYNTFILNYSVAEKAKFPRPLQDVSRAIVYVRRNGEKLNIDTEKVFVIGFSAGGHLSASIGTFWHCSFAAADETMKYGENKPTAVITSYPVISSGEFAHRDSFYNILGTNEPTEDELLLYSIEKHITDKTVPAFIWHTAVDDCVPCENSLLYAMALSKEKIPFELHMYPGGQHGLSIANKETDCGYANLNSDHIGSWFEDSIKFLGEF